MFGLRNVILILCMMLTACDHSRQGIELQLYGGETVPWQSYRGQWVFINYWAEWCKPCLKEIPELNRLAQLPEVAVLGINYDGVAAAELQRLQSKFDIKFALLQDDPGPALSIQRPTVLPATVVYAPSGEPFEILLGPQTLASLENVMKKSFQSQ